jgi:hypothetical protein
MFLVLNKSAVIRFKRALLSFSLALAELNRVEANQGRGALEIIYLSFVTATG